jgi:SAM-dependent methyltransferase
MVETAKAYERRLTEGYFEKYCQGEGIDIGCGNDPLTLPYHVRGTVRLWDIANGDATLMQGITDELFDFVYSSHCLEHVLFPASALRNWWRILKRGGFLLLNIPHRDLYEKRLALPSAWNPDHKSFWLVNRNEPPNTYGIVPLIRQELDDAFILRAEVVTTGRVETAPDRHSIGEFSIEVVVQKMLGYPRIAEWTRPDRASHLGLTAAQ